METFGIDESYRPGMVRFVVHASHPHAIGALKDIDAVGAKECSTASSIVMFTCFCSSSEEGAETEARRRQREEGQERSSLPCVLHVLMCDSLRLQTAEEEDEDKQAESEIEEEFEEEVEVDVEEESD